MIKTVIFDLDGTLYDFNSAHAVAFDSLCGFADDRLRIPPEQFRKLHAEANRIMAKRCGGSPAVHNRLLRYQVILELAGMSISDAPEMADCYWHTLLDHMEPEPGIEQAMKDLRSMGLLIGVGTNMTADWQYAKLSRLSLFPLVDYLVTSEEANSEKPDRGLFDLCAEKAGAAPEECVFVGDNLHGDAVGACAAGMRGIWYQPLYAGEPLPEGVQVIRSMAELPPLLAPNL